MAGNGWRRDESIFGGIALAKSILVGCAFFASKTIKNDGRCQSVAFPHILRMACDLLCCLFTASIHFWAYSPSHRSSLFFIALSKMLIGPKPFLDLIFFEHVGHFLPFDHF
jgi:hypothetical protein